MAREGQWPSGWQRLPSYSWPAAKAIAIFDLSTLKYNNGAKAVAVMPAPCALYAGSDLRLDGRITVNGLAHPGEWKAGQKIADVAPNEPVIVRCAEVFWPCIDGYLVLAHEASGGVTAGQKPPGTGIGTCLLQGIGVDDGDIAAFDYLVIRYIWIVGSGVDLDTRTAFLDLDPTWNGQDVGWSRLNEIGPGPDFYMTWGGDNTGVSGQEAVMIDQLALKDDYPNKESVKIRLRGNWFSSVGTGDITLQFAAYRGGTMSIVSNDFVNTGGELVADVSRAVNLPGPPVAADVDGTDLGTVTINLVTGTGTIAV